MELINIHKDHNRLIKAYMALECAVGTVVESLVVLDRWLYLAEDENITPMLIPVFDKDISPRNIMIFALKGIGAQVNDLNKLHLPDELYQKDWKAIIQN